MRIQQKHFFTLVASACFGVAFAQPLPKASPESVGMSSERLEKITATFKQEIAEKIAASLVNDVIRSNQL